MDVTGDEVVSFDIITNLRLIRDPNTTFVLSRYFVELISTWKCSQYLLEIHNQRLFTSIKEFMF